ncbi:hypothetical protein ACS0TY_025657 [Phlomoides rotata]
MNGRSYNGNPRSPDSLHYVDPSGFLNAYQQIFMEYIYVTAKFILGGEVIQFYDSDRRFPAWGFGGKVPNGSVSHCFNLNGSPSEFEVEGVDGIMAAYLSALHNIDLSGPTLFGQDGVLSDLQETINSLVRVSDLPLSILIVGVGNADFKAVEILDASHRLESKSGRIETRYIVQFVLMREVHGKSKKFLAVSQRWPCFYMVLLVVRKPALIYGKIPYYSMPPTRNAEEPSEVKVVTKLGKEFNVDEVYGAESSCIGSLKSVNDFNPVEVPSSCPLNFDMTILEDNEPPQGPIEGMDDQTMESGEEKVIVKEKSAKSKQNEKLYAEEGMLNSKLKKAEKKRRKKESKSSAMEHDGNEDYDFKVDYVKDSAMEIGNEDIADESSKNRFALPEGVELDNE